MNAHLSELSSKQNREISDLCADILEIGSTQLARELVLGTLSKWLSLDQAVWVMEPRSLNSPKPGSMGFLSLRSPINPALFDPMMTFRHRNPLLRAMVERSDLAPIRPTDFLSRTNWNRNPFQNEVCLQMGLREMMAVEVNDSGPNQETIYAAVIGRDKGSFSQSDYLRFDRIRWSIRPLMAHLKKNESSINQTTIEVPVNRLTPREQEVLHWMGKGKRNREIATIIKCAPRTVEKHVESILRKTNAESRVDAIIGRTHL